MAPSAKETEKKGRHALSRSMYLMVFTDQEDSSLLCTGRCSASRMKDEGRSSDEPRFYYSERRKRCCSTRFFDEVTRKALEKNALALEFACWFGGEGVVE